MQNNKYKKDFKKETPNNLRKMNYDPDTLIIGRNPVMEALSADKNIDTVFVSGEGGLISKICAVAKEKGIVVKDVSPVKLDNMCAHANHQGVIAMLACAEYSSVEDILSLADEKGEAPFIIIADEIEDPHNLGAIIRTAEAAGAHGLIVPKRRSASLNSTVYKTSAGAASVLKVARVANLASTIDDLKKKGIWIYGADMNGTDMGKTSFDGAVGIVVGSEGNGIGRLIKEKCDVLVNIPMYGKINSLNASVAAAVVMYEVVRQKICKGAKK